MFKIAISGKANSGKNTAAEMFARQLHLLGTQEKIVALADPIKQMILKMFPGSDSECLFGPSQYRSNIISNKYISNGIPLTYRQALIDLGAFGRKYNKDIWLNCLIEDVNQSKNINAYIVADVRYPNEFQFLKKTNFTMIRILRDEFTKIDDSSEFEQDSIKDSEFDFVLNNNGSMADLLNLITGITNNLSK